MQTEMMMLSSRREAELDVMVMWMKMAIWMLSPHR